MTPDFDISNYIFIIVLLLIVYVPVRIVLNLVRRKKYKLNPLREAGMLVFAIYTYITAYRVIFPYLEVNLYTDELRMLIQAENTFIPFEKILDSFGMILGGSITEGLGEILRPIVVFIPIGFLLALLWDVFYNKLIMSAVFALVFGLILQVPQIWTFRGFSTDDAILYAVGAILGVILLRFVEKFAHNRNKYRPIPIDIE